MRGHFRQFSNKNVQMLVNFFPLLFPKDSESLKILDIQLQEVGEKIALNGTSKVNRHTNTRTDRQTFRLIESIGPEGRCFENNYILFHRAQHFTSFSIDIENIVYLKGSPEREL